MGTSRLHKLHETKFQFVSRIEFIRSKLSKFFLLMYPGPVVQAAAAPSGNCRLNKLGCRYREYGSGLSGERLSVPSHDRSAPTGW